MKILYYIVYGLWYMLSLLPLRVHYVLSDVIFLLLYHILGYRKKVVRTNLQTSFPEKSQEELKQIERDYYHFFCDYVVESVKMMTISEQEMRRRMVFKNMEAVDSILAEGQSIALYLGHYCNWEWVTSLPLWLPANIQPGQIYHPIENRLTDQLFLRARQHFNSLCIPMQDTLRRLLEFSKSNRPMVIGYISDQKPHWVNIHHWVDFLNHDTPVLTGTERIVRKLNHAVFYIDMQRKRRGYYEAELKLITRHPQQMHEFEITDIYYQMLEKTIRRAPAYWLWSHDRWKRTREEFNERFEVVNGKVREKSSSVS
ncbi:MAG: lysophospholipid acyltransferase family protein [Prevotella sp.]|nr:lysophospholipid acyltransferase family protein [Prevotella sp.]